jgi:hypothetical protein
MLGFSRQQSAPAAPMRRQLDGEENVGIVPAAWPPASGAIRLPPAFWPGGAVPVPDIKPKDYTATEWRFWLAAR